MLSEKHIPKNLPRQYWKHYEELHELLNLIFFTLREVRDGEWRRKLAEMCIFLLALELNDLEVSDINQNYSRTEWAGGRQYSGYFWCT